jgi:hypothetical protein
MSMTAAAATAGCPGRPSSRPTTKTTPPRLRPSRPTAAVVVVLMLASSSLLAVLLPPGGIGGPAVADAYRGPVVCPTKRRTWWFRPSPAAFFVADSSEGMVSAAPSSFGVAMQHPADGGDGGGNGRRQAGPVQHLQHPGDADDGTAPAATDNGSDGGTWGGLQHQHQQDQHRQVTEALPSPLMDARGHLIDSPQALAQLVSSRRVALYFAGSPCNGQPGIHGADNYNGRDNYKDDGDDDDDRFSYYRHGSRDGNDENDENDDEERDPSCCVLVDPATTVDEVEFMLPQYREALQQTNQDIQLIYVPSCDDTLESQMERMQELGLELGVPPGPASDNLKRRFAVWSASEMDKFVSNDDDDDCPAATATPPSSSSSSSGSRHRPRTERRSGVPAFVVLSTEGEELALLDTRRHSIQALAEWPLDDPRGIW